MVVIYSLTSIFALRNIYAYLYRKGHWRNYFLSSFYTLVVILFTFRLLEVVDFMQSEHYQILDTRKDVSSRKVLIGNEANIFATFIKVVIACLQLGSIIEMILRLNQSIAHCNKEDYPDTKLDRQIFINYFIQTALGVALLIFAITETVLVSTRPTRRDIY